MLSLGLDPEADPHLADTPVRFTQLIADNTVNYRREPEFTTEAEYDRERQIKATLFSAGQVDSLVVERDVTFSSMCAHHFAPFMGVAHIGYLPSGKIVGISKFARVIDFFCRRPQTQEMLTEEIARCLHDLLQPRFLGVIMDAEHTCVSCRGPRKLGARTITSKFLHSDGHETTKQEFLRLILRSS